MFTACPCGPRHAIGDTLQIQHSGGSRNWHHGHHKDAADPMLLMCSACWHFMLLVGEILDMIFKLHILIHEHKMARKKRKTKDEPCDLAPSNAEFVPKSLQSLRNSMGMASSVFRAVVVVFTRFCCTYRHYKAEVQECQISEKLTETSASSSSWRKLLRFLEAY